LGERDRAQAFVKMRAFIDRLYAEPRTIPDLLNAHQRGHTRDEELRLAQPVTALSPKNLQFALLRAAMRSLGMLSDGIRLGFRTGFDSGSTLDYVYRNKSAGTAFIGRLIDRNYLDSVGWRGIRVRKVHLERAIRAAAERLRESAQPLRIVDIAAGHGRYVLEAVQKLAAPPEAVLLRDYSEINVRDGSALAASMGLGGFARFEKGDAFDEGSLAAISPRPTLAIVSGLYELFSDNERVLRSLNGLSRALAPGAMLIYTGQPWHPQLELIARTLTSHRDGQPWIMRRRTQAELDQLTAHCGFSKLEQWVDEWGIFTVSLAVRE
jgi:hypothetical protein